MTEIYQPTEEALRVAEQCYPILAGKPSLIQGAALADLVSRHVAGHVVPNNPKATGKLRAEVLELFIECVEGLIPVNDALVIQPELERRRRR